MLKTHPNFWRRIYIQVSICRDFKHHAFPEVVHADAYLPEKGFVIYSSMLPDGMRITGHWNLEWLV